MPEQDIRLTGRSRGSGRTEPPVLVTPKRPRSAALRHQVDGHPDRVSMTAQGAPRMDVKSRDGEAEVRERRSHKGEVRGDRHRCEEWSHASGTAGRGCE